MNSLICGHLDSKLCWVMKFQVARNILVSNYQLWRKDYSMLCVSCRSIFLLYIMSKGVLYPTLGTFGGGFQPDFLAAVDLLLLAEHDGVLSGVFSLLLWADIKVWRKLLKFLFVSLSSISDSLLDFVSRESSGSCLIACLFPLSYSPSLKAAVISSSSSDSGVPLPDRFKLSFALSSDSACV